MFVFELKSLFSWNLSLQYGWKCENAGNKGGDVENQGGNLGIAEEMTQEDNGNDKFEEWRSQNNRKWTHL